MNRDRVRAFFFKPPAGGKTLQLVQEKALGEHSVLGTWPAKQLEEAREAASGDTPVDRKACDRIIDEALNAAQEQAEALEEQVRCLFIWLGQRDNNLRSGTHTATPEAMKKEQRRPAPAVSSSESGADRVCGELLRAFIEKDKVFDRAVGALDKAMNNVLEASNKALGVQQQTIDSLSKALSRVPESTALTRTPEEIAAELETQSLKQAGIRKAIEFLPDMIGLGISGIAKHYGLLAEDAGAARVTNINAAASAKRV